MADRENMGGLDWNSPEVVSLVASLPPHQRLVPLRELNDDARATLRHELGSNGSQVDTPASPAEALADMRSICSELNYLPPLCQPKDVDKLRQEMMLAMQLHYCTVCPDSSGLVSSPTAEKVRRLMADSSGKLDVLATVFKRLTDITRKPEGSLAPGTPDGPPARVTIRDLKPSTASTLGEPKHVDVKATSPLDAPRVEGLVRRPRLIWTFDDKNPLRIISWRARACIETVAPGVGCGIVLSERLRCDPPFLHEGMTTDLHGAQIGPRLQLVTDPDWFNVDGAIEEFPPELRCLLDLNGQRQQLAEPQTHAQTAQSCCLATSNANNEGDAASSHSAAA